MPAILPFIPSMIQGGLGLAQTITGAIQGGMNRRPAPIEYNIPTGLTNYMTQVGMMARSGLPGEDITRERIGSQVSGAIGDIGRSADTAAGATSATRDVYLKSLDAVRDLGLRGAEYRSQMQQQAAQAELTRADYQDKAWEYNVHMPWAQKMHEYQSTRAGGMQNMWRGLDTMGSAAVSAYSGFEQRQGMQQLIDAIKGIPRTGS